MQAMATDSEICSLFILYLNINLIFISQLKELNLERFCAGEPNSPRKCGAV